MGTGTSITNSAPQDGFVLRFTVPGKVRGKGRPRFGKTKAGNAIAFTDAKTAAYENLIKLAARDAGARMIEGPVAVIATITIEIPKSASKKQRAEMLAGRVAPCRKPDIDNVVKALMDGLNTVAFRDDVQVVQLGAAKRWGNEPSLRVIVKPLSPEELA